MWHHDQGRPSNGSQPVLWAPFLQGPVPEHRAASTTTSSCTQCKVISKQSGSMQECPSYDYTSEKFRARWRPEGMRECWTVEEGMSEGPTRGFVFIGPVFLSIIFMYASLTVPQRWRRKAVADLVKTSPLGTMARATFTIQRPCIMQLLLQVAYTIFWNSPQKWSDYSKKL